MTILFDSARTVKPETFARGIPSLGRRPYTQADLDWAAQAFGDTEADRENRRLDEQALEAAWHAAYEAGLTGPDPRPSDEGRCDLCGKVADLNEYGLCDRCDDAATNATIAGVNGRAGLGYRVF